jgi:hypothetical protein
MIAPIPGLRSAATWALESRPGWGFRTPKRIERRPVLGKPRLVRVTLGDDAVPATETK